MFAGHHCPGIFHQRNKSYFLSIVTISIFPTLLLLHETQVIWLILVACSCEDMPKFHIHYHLRPAGLKTLSNWDCSCCLGDQVTTSLSVLVSIWNITFFRRGLYSSCHLPCNLIVSSLSQIRSMAWLIQEIIPPWIFVGLSPLMLLKIQCMWNWCP